MGSQVRFSPHCFEERCDYLCCNSVSLWKGRVFSKWRVQTIYNFFSFFRPSCPKVGYHMGGWLLLFGNMCTTLDVSIYTRLTGWFMLWWVTNIFHLLVVLPFHFTRVLLCYWWCCRSKRAYVDCFSQFQLLPWELSDEWHDLTWLPENVSDLFLTGVMYSLLPALCKYPGYCGYYLSMHRFLRGTFPKM